MADSIDGTIKASYLPGTGRGKDAEVKFTLYDSPLTKSLAALLGVSGTVKATIGGETVYITKTNKPNNQLIFSRKSPEEAAPVEEPAATTESFSLLKSLL